MGDYVELKVKFVDAHGVGVEGVPMYAELLGYWTLGPVKTGTDGVANFGNVNMNVAVECAPGQKTKVPFTRNS